MPLLTRPADAASGWCCPESTARSSALPWSSSPKHTSSSVARRFYWSWIEQAGTPVVKSSGPTVSTLCRCLPTALNSNRQNVSGNSLINPSSIAPLTASRKWKKSLHNGVDSSWTHLTRSEVSSNITGGPTTHLFMRSESCRLGMTRHPSRSWAASSKASSSSSTWATISFSYS